MREIFEDIADKEGANVMIAAVEATFDGTNFVMEEQLDLVAGQKVIIMLLDESQNKTRSKTRADIDLDKYIGRGRKMFSSTSEIDDYVRGLRDYDRL